MRSLRPWLVALALATVPPHLAVASEEHGEAALERESLGTAALFAPTSATAHEVMQGLLCQCPGCQAKRITIRDCACGYAAQQREQVLAVLATQDLATPEGRAAAARAAFADQVTRYGGGVRAQPSSSMVWLLPMAAATGGLGLLIAGARRWRRRAAPATAATAPEDDVLADRLDDELALSD